MRLADAMQIVFIASWCVAVLGFFYVDRYFIPMWKVGFKKDQRHQGYWKRVAIGAGVTVAAALVGLASAGVAELAGGWG